MTAGEYCNREVMIVEPEVSITEVASMMREHHVGTLVVVEREGTLSRPIGIITDRDLVIDVMAQQVPLDALIVKDVMNKDLVYVPEQETLLNTIALMQSRGVRRIIVLDDDGCLQGIISADDTIELLAEAMNNLCNLVGREIANEQSMHP